MGSTEYAGPSTRAQRAPTLSAVSPQGKRPKPASFAPGAGAVDAGRYGELRSGFTEVSPCTLSPRQSKGNPVGGGFCQSSRAPPFRRQDHGPKGLFSRDLNATVKGWGTNRISVP